MVVLRSGHISIKSEPEEPAASISPPSAVNVSLPLSPPTESSIEISLVCKCGNPLNEEICTGRGNPANAGRIMYVCPLPEHEQCGGHQWKDEINPTPETHLKQEVDIDGNNDREVTPTVGPSTITPPTSPPERPPPPTGNHVCWCKPPQLALQQFQKFCEDGRQEDVNKYYYSPVYKCHHWRRIESDADALKRINTRKQGLGHKQYDLLVQCDCGQPASWDVARQGQYAGKAFYGCETYGCRYWKLEEELFGLLVVNRYRRGGYMDYLSACDEYNFEPDYEATEEDMERIKNEDDMLAAMSTFIEDLPDSYYEQANSAVEDREKDSNEDSDEDMDDYDYEDYDDYCEY